MKSYLKHLLVLCMGVFITMGCSSVADSDWDAAEKISHETNSTAKSHFKDGDGNGIPDVGETVTGAYKSIYAYDASGDWYWDLGDGRIQGTAGSVNELDTQTLTTCYYKVQYRGSFENDPFLDSGWIKNNINCKGYDDNGTYNYLIVHETDPRYTGNPDWSIWGSWEYFVSTESGKGNMVRPKKHSG